MKSFALFIRLLRDYRDAASKYVPKGIWLLSDENWQELADHIEATTGEIPSDRPCLGKMWPSVRVGEAVFVADVHVGNGNMQEVAW